jgi:hypothetical protein
MAFQFYLGERNVVMANDTAVFKRLRLVGIGAVVVGVLGVAVLYFSFRTEPPEKEANISAPSSAQLKPDKPVQAMNLALGNMVFLAREMGFVIRTNKGKPYDGNKVAARIESHLRRLREFYRQESGKDPALVGSVLLQFDVSPAGEVSQVKKLSARLKDSAFKKAIVAEVAKWSFTDLVSETIRVTCPLLFVREGMDITTLVLWEKSLSNLEASPAAVRSAGEFASKVTAKIARPGSAHPPASTAQLLYSTYLRKAPNFSATPLMTLTEGTRVTVVNETGDWLRVRATSDGPTGFIRREFVKPLEVAGN